MVQVNVQEAKTHLSKYLDEVEKGEVVVVCRHNKPIAELRAIQPAVRPSRPLGLYKGQISWTDDCFAPMTEEELAEFDGPIFPE